MDAHSGVRETLRDEFMENHDRESKPFWRDLYTIAGPVPCPAVPMY
jgi:hypothetical protein